MTSAPYLFDEFFASGKEESISPFLTPASRKWGKNLSLKSALLSMLLLALAFAFSFINDDTSHFFTASVFFLVGTPALLSSIEDLRSFEINIDFLMTVAALLSVLIGSELEGGLLLVLFELSASLERTVTTKTKGALISLHELSPKRAIVRDETGRYFEQAVRDVALNAHILVRSGEVVPLDGEVVDGSSMISLAHLTGESLPLSKTKGDEVPAGSRLLDGSLTLRVTRHAQDSTLQRLIDLITQASETKPTWVRMVDRFGKQYALGVMGLFFFFAATLPWMLDVPYLGPEGGVYRALAFLIAASPCALVLATPTAYLAALSACARRGIVLKGGTFLEAIASTKRIAFDKTGTLTHEEVELTSITPLHNPDNHSILDALQAAATIERHTVHPLARAIIRAADKEKLLPLDLGHFQTVPGQGVLGEVTFQGKVTNVRFGQTELIRSEISPHLIPKDEEGSLLLMGNSLFSFRFQEMVRPRAHEALKLLKEREKLQLYMLTGDSSVRAQRVADTLSLFDEVRAELKPEEKLEAICSLSKEGLIMVGDGINDAPALARATVGISMGRIGSRTAVDASDVVLLQEDLTLIPWLIKKSKSCRRIVAQNLTLALGVILFATTPALLGAVPLWLAVILHEGGTLLVGLNSLRLLRK